MDTAQLGQVLTALAQGAAGQAGQQAWTALAAMTARLLGRDPAEAACAGTLDPAQAATLLARRADDDPDFAVSLQDWLAGAQALLTTGPVTANQVNGEVSGTVIQAGEVSGGISFGAPPDPPGSSS